MEDLLEQLPRATKRDFERFVRMFLAATLEFE
jgi:hypothetical protein